MKTTRMPTDYSEWLNDVKSDSIAKDLALLDDFKQMPYHDHPVKLDKIALIFLKKGKIEVGFNLRKYAFEAPCVVYGFAGEIVQYFDASDDVSTASIVISEQLMKDFQIDVQLMLPTFFYLKEYHSIPLKEDELALLMEYYALLGKSMNRVSDFFSKEATKYLVKSLFFNAIDFLQPHIAQATKNKKSRQETIFEEFARLIPQYYKTERSLDFYAEKMCLTPKHLSEVIKKASKKSANNWIDDFVCLEAKALLKSTNMTIQQISDELNFPSQSFFGKYFKRVMGVSPKEYRNG